GDEASSDRPDGGGRDASDDRNIGEKSPSDRQTGPRSAGQGDDAGRTGESIGAIIARRTTGSRTITDARADRSAGVADRGSSPDSPWTGRDWRVAREQAGRAIREQRVPADTRDVVRRYFNTDD
ncbi:MAG TPA: hypothetical protein PKB10_09055, partial [Tepidisphaeraceae bacterium]|nr:hypothetical protein [Tepidisphaeraceae bacterium]